jgi:predicted kinase
MKALILVRGLPGSGKTTFANALNEQKYGGQAALVSADDYMLDHEGNYRFNAEMLSRVHGSCQATAASALSDGMDVIVHNTFTTAKEFKPYLKMVKSSQKLLIYDLFDAGLTDEQLVARNVHNVPASSVTKMRSRYAPAPVPETPVHIDGEYAYWQFPSVDWLKMQ